MASNLELRLDADLVAVDLQALQQRMLDALTAEGVIIVDASAVERAGTACLQLLTALAVEAVGSERALVWRNPSRSFLDAARLLGLREALGLPKEA